jgi:hypothetical protein
MHAFGYFLSGGEGTNGGAARLGNILLVGHVVNPFIDSIARGSLRMKITEFQVHKEIQRVLSAFVPSSGRPFFRLTYREWHNLSLNHPLKWPRRPSMNNQVYFEV